MRREFVVLFVLLSVFFAIGCAETNKKEAEPTGVVTPGAVETQPISEGKVVEVAIQNSSYKPDVVTISSDDTVRWTNMDNIAHTATGEMFDSGTLQPGKSFEFLFTDPGTYNYYCSIHPDMKGTVIVTKE